MFVMYCMNELTGLHELFLLADHGNLFYYFIYLVLQLQVTTEVFFCMFYDGLVIYIFQILGCMLPFLRGTQIWKTVHLCFS
jgi:hypothetical protein